MGVLDLFQYSDYRSYLKDFYEKEKRRNPSYSYRVFARKARLGSPNYLKLVITGSRRITDRTLPAFIRGLRLSRSEADYFKNLVLYQESTDPDAKSSYLTEVLRARKRVLLKIKTIDATFGEYVANWWHSVIREMIMLPDFSEDPAWVAARLGGRIKPQQAAESLKLLESLGLVRRENGKLTQAEPLLSTQDDVSSLQIRLIQKQFCELGTRSLLEDPIDEREVSGLTVAIASSKMPEIKKAIREFRRELNRLASPTPGEEESADRVYHLHINLFPLTKGPKDAKDAKDTQ